MSELDEFDFGLFKAKPAVDDNLRLAMLLWGPSGTGKTLLAWTAPGKKLWINFDPDGTQTLLGYPDYTSLDLTQSSAATVAAQFSGDNPFGLDNWFKQHPEYETVVVDSLTTYSSMMTDRAVSITKGATIDRPSPGAYGSRNAQVLRMVNSLMRVTKLNNRHIIFISHEAAPDKNEEGIVILITVMLGGQLPEQTSINLSEVWNLRDTGKERMITVRSVGVRKPMKSRMFDTTVDAEFPWRFNPITRQGQGIADWYNAWRKAGAKIKVPK